MDQTTLQEKMQEQKEALATAHTKLPDYKISDTYKGLSVIGLVADYSACGYYRVINPLHMLKMHGANVSYSSHQTAQELFNYDYIVAPRQHSSATYELIRELVWYGKKVIFEIDDDLNSVLPDNPAYFSYHNGSPELAGMDKIISSCLGLTCTTPEIAKWYSRLNRNVSVIENCIDFSFRNWGAEVSWNGNQPTIKLNSISKPEVWEGKTVIGYSFGGTHQADIHQIGPQIKRVLNNYPNTVFAMYCSIDAMQSFVAQYQLPINQVFHVTARHFLDHPSGLHGFDINLAPLVCCQFNLAKSSLKLCEGMACGAVSIGSNVGPYARFERRHPGKVLTVGEGKWSYSTWYDAIAYLLDNPDIMKKMQTEGRQLIADEYSLERNFVLWPHAWNSIMENVNKGIIGPPDKLQHRSFYSSYGKLGRNDPCWCGTINKSGKPYNYKDCCKVSHG